jgi:hypothetical protein
MPERLMETVTRVIQSLKTEFLALVIINILFLGFFIWFIDSRANHTTNVLQQLLDLCLARQNKGG